MKQWVTEYVKGCATCQANKPNTHPNQPAIFPITPKEEALLFQMIAVDWITKLPISEGFNSIMMVTDQNCSKAVIFVPCNKTMGMTEMTELYLQNVAVHYGIPERAISD